MPCVCLEYFLPLTPFNRDQLPVPDHTGDKHRFGDIWPVAYLFLYCFVVFGAWIAHHTWWNAILFPLCLSTSVFAWRVYRWISNDRNSLDSAIVRPADVFRSFSHGFFSAGILCTLIQSVAGVELLYLGFGNTSGAKVWESWIRDEFSQYTGKTLVHVFAVLFAIITGLSQEWVKQLVITHCYKIYLDFPTKLVPADMEAYKWLGGAVGYGMGVMNTVLFTCFMLVKSPERAVVSALIKLIVYTPFQCVLGYMWGITLAKSDILLRQGLTDVAGQKPRSMCSILYRLGWRQYLLHALLDSLRLEFFLWIGKSSIKQEIVSGLFGAVLLTISICVADLMHPRVHREKQRVDGEDHEMNDDIYTFDEYGDDAIKYGSDNELVSVNVRISNLTRSAHQS